MNENVAGCFTVLFGFFIIALICTYIVEILITIGCLIGLGLLGFLAWRFRAPLLVGLVMLLKLLAFLTLATLALVFWEIPKWFYKRYKKI